MVSFSTSAALSRRAASAARPSASAGPRTAAPSARPMAAAPGAKTTFTGKSLSAVSARVASARQGSAKERRSAPVARATPPPKATSSPVLEPMEEKKRWAMVFCLFCAFVLCNLDKVNMSVAIVPMAEQFNWSGTEKGLVQSAFFWGYTFTQVPGGFLASKLGGKTVLLWGVLLWSFGTLIAPWCANMGMGALLASRFIVGLGEGVAPAAATGVLSRTIPAEERSRATTSVFGGLDVGSLTGLLIAPPIILGLGGWQAVFYLFGALGFMWGAWWYLAFARGSAPAPADAAAEAAVAEKTKAKTPWKALFSHPQLLVISVVHFSWNWFSYGLLAYMPSFFKGALGLSLTKSSVLSILPYASTICVMLFVGSICDGLVKSGKMNLTQVRKFSQSVCFLGGAIASTGIAATLLTINPVVGATTTQFVTIMGLLIATFGCGAFCRTGLFCTHQDISPKYASIMLGMTNTVAAIASSLATYCIGLLLDYTNNNWALALFAPMVVLNIVSTLIFVSFYKSDPVDFDSLEAGGSQVKVAAISCEPVPEDEQPKKETPAPVAGSSPVKVAAVEAEEEFPQEKLVLFGITCPDNKGAQFAILTVGSLVCSIGFSALQEGVTRVPGFKFSGWMTLITTVAYMACALIEMVATKGKIERKGSWANYVALSTMTFGGMYATNYALKFLNYATRIVAKSSKVIPVMIFSTIINGKKYNWKEWGAVGCLVIGIILFTLGDVASMPSFSPIGIVLITAALCIDAITSNFEERVFFRVKTPSSHSEVLFFASLFGSIWSFASCYLTGELGPAIAHSVANPSVVPSILSFSVLGYASVSFILGMIKFFGATEAEIVKSCRKVLSIVISFVLFPKALNWKYIAGFVVVVASIAWTFQLKQEKIKAKEAAKLAAAKEA